MFDVLLFSVGGYILLLWISDNHPEFSQWFQHLTDLIPLKAMTYWLNVVQNLRLRMGIFSKINIQVRRV